jgi:hypothetical protein
MPRVHLLRSALCSAACLAGVAGCLGPECGNSILIERVSPGKEWTAVLFERDCGATTWYSTQVSLVSQGSSLPNEVGNVFNSREQLEHPGVVWLSPNELEVSGVHRLSVAKALASFKGIRIRYVEESPWPSDPRLGT